MVTSHRGRQRTWQQRHVNCFRSTRLALTVFSLHICERTQRITEADKDFVIRVIMHWAQICCSDRQSAWKIQFGPISNTFILVGSHVVGFFLFFVFTLAWWSAFRDRHWHLSASDSLQCKTNFQCLKCLTHGLPLIRHNYDVLDKNDASVPGPAIGHHMTSCAKPEFPCIFTWGNNFLSKWTTLVKLICFLDHCRVEIASHVHTVFGNVNFV